MDVHGRRTRRRRGHSRPNMSPCGKPWGFVNGLCSFFIMSSLIAIIYLMLEYHCSTCNAKCNLNNITQNIDDIAKNLSYIKNSYYELETKISQLSQDLPKIEGQIEVLESLANIMNRKDFIWDSKKQFNLPNVDIYLNRPSQIKLRNITKTCSNKETRIED